MSNSWHIVGGRIMDPAVGRDKIGDICIRDGLIVTDPAALPESCPRIDARGLVVAPGLIDIHVHFREPGNELAETIETGSAAAARGGFTTVVTMPNTQPPADCAERVAEANVRGKKCNSVRILPAGAITMGRSGHELTDLQAMAAAGVAAFTDDGTTVPDAELMQKAMSLAESLHLPILDHALSPEAVDRGVMHEGTQSRRLGLPGIPSEAETDIVRRDIRLCALTGCRTHIQHLSAGESIEHIREARAKGFPLTAEVTPHHLALVDTDVRPENTSFKMNPPLRSTTDREALAAAVVDGTIQAFATDHAPHTAANKAKGFLSAPSGVVGLETAVGVTYAVTVQTGAMDLTSWLTRWTLGPAAVLGIPSPCLGPGNPADVVLLDLNMQWTVKSDEFLSRSRNTPFEGFQAKGKPIFTFCRGHMTWNGNPKRVVDTTA